MSVRMLSASLRGYRRVLILSVGIILAVSLFAGINIGVESISRGVLASYVQRVPYDMTFVQQDPNASYVKESQQLLGIPNIVRAEPVISWSPFFLANISAPSGKNVAAPGFILEGVSAGFASRYNVTVTQGSWNLTKGLIVPDALAVTLNLKVGDSINLTLGYYRSGPSPSTNYWSILIPVAGFAVYSPLAQSLFFGFYVDPSSPSSSGFTVSSNGFPVVMSYDMLRSDYHAFAAQVLKSSQYVSGQNFQINYRIFLNRNAVINLFDADATLSRLVSIEDNIRIQLGFGSVQDHLANAVSTYRSWIQENIIGFYFFSLPVLPITWYLAMTSWYMTTSRRRQEFGLLKVRGVSSRQIFRTAILESVIVGIIGSALGVIAGFLVGAIVALILGSPPSLAITPSAITPDLLVTSAFVGTFISVLAAFRPARLAARLEPTEAVKEYQGEEVEVGKPWRPTWTWGAVVLGTYKMLEWIFGFSPTTIFPYGSPFNGSFILQILYFIWVALSGILTVIAPFLFVYGVTKIVTRNQTRLYQSSVLLLRAFMKDLANLTARSITRNPARASRIAFLIALTITFGIFVNVVSATTYDLTIRYNRLQAGADISVVTYPSSNLNETFVSNLTAVPGVGEATPIFQSSANTPYSGAQGLTVYGINASNFLDVAFAQEDFTVGSPAPLIQKMQSTPNATIITQGLANYLGLKVGSKFEIISQRANSSSTIHLTIIGFFTGMPGFGSLGTGGGPIVVGPGGPPIYYSNGAIVVNLSFLRNVSFKSSNPYSSSFTFLCKLQPRANPEEVATNLRSLLGPNMGNVQTYQERIQQFTSNAGATGLFKFLELVSAYLLVAAVVGFAIVSWANTNDHLREISLFRARGTSRKQALQILFAESFVILLIALAVGAATGLVSAYGFLVSTTSLSTRSAYPGLAVRLVAPEEIWIMLVASVAGFLISIFISGWLSLRKTVVQMVRFR